jgi:hypothetical protein
MTTIGLILAAVLAVAAVLYAALPFLREPQRPDGSLATSGEDELRRLHLLEERDRALAALKELEFDHRTGKVSDDDYEQLVGQLRLEAAEALEALDEQALPAVREEAPS